MNNRALMRRFHDTPQPLGRRSSPLSSAWLLRAGAGFGLLLLGACASSSPGSNGVAEPEVQEESAHATREAAGVARALHDATRQLLRTPPGGSAWAPWLIPGKRFATFEPVLAWGWPAIRVKANRSVSILRQRYPEGLEGVNRLSFSWRIDALAVGADLATAEADDSPARVVLAFNGDRTRLSPRMHRLSDMSRLLTGEDLPYATLAYVWSNNDPPGTILVNPRSDRIRKIVVESGALNVGRWMTYERDVEADYRAAFGEAPGALTALALMTDTDNTRARLHAWYGPLTLQRRDAGVLYPVDGRGADHER